MSSVIFVVLFLTVVTLFVGIGTISKRGKASPNHADRVNRALAALSDNPNDLAALETLASSYYDEEDWDRSIKSFEALLELMPPGEKTERYFWDVVRYGVSLLHAGKNKQARLTLQQAQSMPFEHFELDYNLGLLAYADNRYAEAKRHMTRATMAAPENREAQRMLALCLYHCREYHYAETILSPYVLNNRNDIDALYVYSIVLYEIGKLNRALKVCEMLYGNRRYRGKACLLLGMINLQQRKFDTAIEYFETGLSDSEIDRETRIDSMYHLGKLYLSQNAIDKCVPLFEQIVRMQPNYKDVAKQLDYNRMLFQNEQLRRYLTVKGTDFSEVCRHIIERYYPGRVEYREESWQKGGYIDICADVQRELWREPMLFRFVRSVGKTGELVLREMYDRMRE